MADAPAKSTLYVTSFHMTKLIRKGVKCKERKDFKVTCSMSMCVCVRERGGEDRYR